MSELQRGLRAKMNVYDDACEVKYEVQSLYEICTELQNTSSTLEKQNILKRNENNELFKELLKFLLDPMIVTGISKKKIEKIDVSMSDIPLCLYDIRNLFNYLKEHNTGTDNDITMCKMAMIYDKDELNDFIKSIITKSLKLGIDVKTANKVYGKDFIPVLDVMLGTSIEKCKIPQDTWFAISQKLNGSRCFYYKGKLYTRQGKVYTGCEHIIKDVKNLTVEYPILTDYVFDGELILKDNSLSDNERFRKGVGIANSNNQTKEELKLVIFDMLPTKEFEAGISKLTYSHRQGMLKSLDFEVSDFENLSVVPMFYQGRDQNEIEKWLNYAEENDMEGIMINLDSPYECRRVKTLIKCKKFFDIDLRCTKIEQGSGKYTNTLGAIVCNYKGNELRVGSGFTDEQRDYYWNNPEEIIGKTVTIKYKEESQNKNGEKSIQFPIFLCVRFDK